jgi:hypothetical protein
LGWALLLALLAHLAAWMLVNRSFAFSFQAPDTSSSLSTRMLEPEPTASLQPSPAPQAVPKPIPKNTRAPAPELMRTDSAAAKPAEEPKNEQKQPIAVEKSALNATETIALISPSIEASSTASTSLVASASEPQGIILRYPASAQLLFDGVNMNKGRAQNGAGVLAWKMDGSGYELTLEASALVIFTRTEKSVGLLSAQGLAPQRYSSTRTGRSEQATHFRPETGKIQFSNNKPEALLLAGAQDRISVLVQLAGIIGGNPERYREGDRIQMQVAGLDSAESWEFNVEGLSDISVPAANMQAFKLSRSPRSEFDQRLEIWLSPQLGYLPIRIRQSSATTPEQDFTDLVLRKLP